MPAGTGRRLAKVIKAAGGELIWNPEFLEEGHAIDETLEPDRIVFGVEGSAGLAAIEEAYAPILAKQVPVVITDYATAELLKVAANAFLATKISFINAMGERFVR